MPHSLAYKSNHTHTHTHSIELWAHINSVNRLKSRRDFNDFNNWTDFNANTRFLHLYTLVHASHSFRCYETLSCSTSLDPFVTPSHVSLCLTFLFHCLTLSFFSQSSCIAYHRWDSIDTIWAVRFVCMHDLCEMWTPNTLYAHPIFQPTFWLHSLFEWSEYGRKRLENGADLTQHLYRRQR